MDETPASDRRRMPLAITAIRPVIRLAHRVDHPLDVAKRCIGDHELVLIQRGACRFRDAHGEQRLEPHHLVFIEPGSPHAFLPAGSCVHLAVHFDFSPETAGHRVQLSGGESLSPLRILTPDDAVETGLQRLLRAWEQNTPTATLRAHAALTEVLARLLETASPRRDLADTVESARMAKAERLLRARFRERISVRDLAKTVGLSTSRFALVFRRWSGYTPMDYQRRLRIDEARRLLPDVDLSIAEVGHRCGYDDPYHFSRVFRAVDGLSPTLYREGLLTGKPGT